MATTGRGASGPGVTVGPTSEFSLFFRVKPGDGESLRAALGDLLDTPGYRPGDYGMAVSSIHEARFVLFDDDTRMAFITSFDGSWDAYMEDFFTSGPTLVLFMNTLPFAKPWDALSEGLIYRFRLRPLTPGAPGDAAPFTAGDDEVVVDCVFSPHVHPNGPRRFEQEGTCTTPAGETVTFRVNDPAGA